MDVSLGSPASIGNEHFEGREQNVKGKDERKDTKRQERKLREKQRERGKRKGTRGGKWLLQPG
jgi:hypothetical protein